MSIKILDTFEPAGEFELVRAKDVKYQEENISVEEKLKSLDEILNAEPELSYADADVSYCPTIKVDLGRQIILEFMLEASALALGNCHYTIERKLTNSNEGFTKVREFTEPKGKKSIVLGIANSLSDSIYRVYATDGLGKVAKYRKIGADGTVTKQNYIEFRIICGGLQFNSTFVNNAKKNIFAVGFTNVSYPFTMNYAVSSYRWLFYTVTGANEQPSSDLSSWNTLCLSDDMIPGGTVLDTNAELTFTNDIFNSVGMYKLHVCAAVSSTNVIEDYSTLVTSNIITDTIEILEDNSIGVTLTQGLDNNLTNESFLKIIFTPKTNVSALQGYKNITALCQIYNNGVLVADLTREMLCTHAEDYTWNIGRLPIGDNYKFIITCSGLGVKPGSAIIDHVQIKRAVGEGTTYVTDNLLFYFDADPQYVNNNTWTTVNSPVDDMPTYSISLNNLNSEQGVKDTQINEEETSVFKLSGDAYGVLLRDGIVYNPWELVAKSSQETSVSGFTFETYFKSKCIGTLTAKAVSACDDFNTAASVQPGFAISYEEANVCTEKVKTTAPLLDDTWQHLTIVLDTNIREDKTKVTSIEDINPYVTLRTYIDGVLIKAANITAEDLLFTGTNYPMVLNGASKISITDILSGSAIEIGNQGDCEFRLLRCYNRGLTSSEIYNNYLNSLLSAARANIITKNNSDILQIYFTKNREVDPIDAAYFAQKGLKNETFDVLNTIKVKKADSTNPFGSKTTLVNCTMHYCIGDTWMREENVDVYLQGTSSLEYPVKNFQIKVFEKNSGAYTGTETRKKKKILPPFKTNADGWYKADSVYTLKCDFMEQSHRNNTPTACYYQDEVLDAVIKYQNGNVLDETKYSPPRQLTETITIENSDETRLIRPYRDAIDGFACIVYCNDNGAADGFSNTDANILGTGDAYVVTALDNFTGSYMFNVDKEGAQLGFEIGELELPENVTGIQVYDNETGLLRYPKDSNGNEVTDLLIEHIPCVSFEGATNDNISAAAFVPWEAYQNELNKSIYNRGYTLYTKDSHGTLVDITFDSFEELNSELDKGTQIFYVGSDGGTRPLITQEAYQNSSNKYDYLKATLEPRFNFADELYDEDDEDSSVDLNVYNELTYSALDRAIKWVYENQNNEKKFKEEFSNYFSFEYCLTYYLQMITFTQTDNAGKNAMFDTWYDGRLYPRPYDMDTQMGLDNSGQDIKLPSSELHLDICPASISGSKVQPGQFGVDNDACSTWSDTTNKNHLRFSAYNTAESRLWKTFAKCFKQEIAQTYIALRNSGVYSVDSICNYINSKTSDVIGEQYYNKDAALKYFSYTSGENNTPDSLYLRCLQGNRKNRYRQFLTQRLIFLDTVYSNTASATNGTIELRAYANEEESYIGIHVYSPQYIRIAVDSAKQADIIAYADPNDTYTLGNGGSTYKGTLFCIPTTGTDKNIVIYGAGNIRAINHTDNLNLTKFDISSATKLTDIDLTNAKYLADLTLDANIYIRNLKLAGTTALRKNLSLQKCTNLENINLYKSAVTGLSIAPGANIKNLNLTDSGIISLTLDSLSMLSSNNLKLEGCNQLSTLSLINCSLLNNVNVAQLEALTDITIDACPNIDTVDLTSLTKLQHINLVGDSVQNVILTDCRGTAFSELNLANLKNLRRLEASSLSIDGTNNRSAKIYLAEDIVLDKLDLRSAKINTLGTSLQTAEGTYDFEKINFSGFDVENGNSTATFTSNATVQVISNLKYRGALNSMFAGCTSLQRLEDCEFTTPKSYTMENEQRQLTVNQTADSMFEECSALTDLGNTDGWDLEAVSSMTSGLQSCPKIKYASIKNLLAKLPNVTSLSSFLLYSYSDDTCIGKLPGYPSVIDKDFFEHNTKVVNITHIFCCTDFAKIEPGIFEPCKNALSTIQGAFAIMPQLTYAPENLLKNCTALTNVSGLFKECPKLGEVGSYKDSNDEDVPCIFRTTFDIFNTINNITTIDVMFAWCPKLQMPSSVLSEDGETYTQSTLYDFMKNLHALKTAIGTFYSCKWLTEIPEGLFKENTELTKLNATFMSTGITKLPNNLFTTNLVTLPINKTHTSLTEAIGLFANCINMEGIVHKYFFIHTPNLQYIGGTVTRTWVVDGRDVLTNVINMLNGSYISCPGMFANTLVSGFHADFLAPLESLQDVSMLFFNSTRSINGSTITVSNCGGNTALSNEGGSNNYKPCLNATGLTDFSIYRDTPGQSDFIPYTNYGYLMKSTELPESLFTHNSSLKSTEGMFGGNDFITKVPASLFKGLTGLKNTSGMFIACNALSEGNLVTLLNGCANLTDVSHMFADCTALLDHLSEIDSEGNTITVFDGCSALQNCKGFLMNSNVIGSVPVTLFNDCRGTITNVSYMFAGCKNLNGVIETGYALINNPETIKEGYLRYLENYYDSAVENGSIDSDSISRDTFIAEAQDNKYTEEDMPGLYTKELYTRYNKVVDIKQKGLLSDCLKLTTVDHMFSGCENLCGPIPADIFYMSGTKNNLITSLAGFFDCCYKLSLNSVNTAGSKADFGNCQIEYILDYSSTDTNSEKIFEPRRVKQYGGGNYSEIYPEISTVYVGNEATLQIGQLNATGTDLLEKCDYFVPTDWLKGLPSLSNISRMFYNVGSLRIPAANNTSALIYNISDSRIFTYSVLNLPNNLFVSQSQIEDASSAFAFVGSIGQTELTSTFLKQSNGKLSNISRIFLFARLKSIGDMSDTVFKDSTKLSNVSRSFYGVNNQRYNSACYTASDIDNYGTTIISKADLADSYAPRFFETTYSQLSELSANIRGAFTGTKVAPYYNNDGSINSNYASLYTDSDNILLETGNFTAPTLTWSSLFGLTIN